MVFVCYPQSLEMLTIFISFQKPPVDEETQGENEGGEGVTDAPVTDGDAATPPAEEPLSGKQIMFQCKDICSLHNMDLTNLS